MTTSLLRRVRTALAAVAVLSTLPGCADGLSFRNNRALQITAPLDGELVSEPLLVEWSMKPRPSSVKGYLVFVDRAPQPPGKTIEHFKIDNRSNIYDATESSVEIPALEQKTDGPSSRRNQHRIVVIPLDGQGRRIGENSAHVEIDVFREEA